MTDIPPDYYIRLKKMFLLIWSLKTLLLFVAGPRNNLMISYMNVTVKYYIGMFIKENLQYNIRDDLSIFIPNILKSIFAEIYINRKPILIGTIYRPNISPKADIDIFMKTMLQNTLTKKTKNHTSWVI